MSTAVRRLLEDAQKLPPEEQADLIDALICDRAADADWSRAWGEECRRREDAVARGDARLISLDELKSRLGHKP